MVLSRQKGHINHEPKSTSVLTAYLWGVLFLNGSFFFSMTMLVFGLETQKKDQLSRRFILQRVQERQPLLWYNWIKVCCSICHFLSSVAFLFVNGDRVSLPFSAFVLTSMMQRSYLLL